MKSLVKLFGLSIQDVANDINVPYYKVGQIISGNGKIYLISRAKVLIFFAKYLYKMYR